MTSRFRSQPVATGSTSFKTLNDYVHHCRREFTTFGAHQFFTDNRWLLDSFFSRVRVQKARFISFTEDSRKNLKSARPFKEPFLSFSKAYVMHRGASWSPTGMASAMLALRALHRALLRAVDVADPTLLTVDICELALSLKSERGARLNPTSARHVGRVVDTLRECGLLRQAFNWSPPPDLNFKKHYLKVGPEYEARRLNQLPSKESLEGLAKVFREAREPRDILGSAVVAILAAAPSRVSEVLKLREDCEVTKIDRDGNLAYYLRWVPGKGGRPMLKPIPSVWVPVVKEAIRRVRVLTSTARKVARWYEQNRVGLYARSRIGWSTDGKYVDVRAVSIAVYGHIVNRDNVYDWLSRGGIRATTRKKGPDRSTFGMYAVSDIGRYIRTKLPKHMPFIDGTKELKCSDALFCLPWKSWGSADGIMSGLFEIPSAAPVQKWLSGDLKAPSVFTRHNLRARNGEALKLRTHQLRHWLNTLALENGVGLIDVAHWSGRRDVAQTDAYDHESDSSALKVLRDSMDKVGTPQGNDPKRAVLISRADFDALQVATAHVTYFGYCIHDYTMRPCQLHRSCMTCMEHVCIKGNDAHHANITALAAQTASLLETARIASLGGVAGSDRWAQYHEAVLRSCQRAQAVEADSALPNGTAFQPAERLPPQNLSLSDSREPLRLERHSKERARGK